MKAEKTEIYGVTVSYLYHKGEGPETIVFIHGLGASKDCFAPALNYPGVASHSVLAADLVGFGASDTPEDYSYTMDDQA